MIHPPLRRLIGAATALLVLAGCGTGPDTRATPAPAGAVSASPTGTVSAGPTAAASAASAVPSAAVGRTADSERVTFAPTRIRLPGGSAAAVMPAATVGGILAVPENVDHVGWWDGSAYAGDPFGTTVLAGHVDSDTQGLGFFARLLEAKVGDRLTVSAGSHRARYQVTSVRTVTKQALSADTPAFDQNGRHRLVLITCTGNYQRDRGGYDSNLVVIAEPVGRAH